MKEILVLGGGASGLAAAIAAAQAGGSRVRVTLLEQNPAPGKKLLATGNGRCNFDNLASGEPERYFTAAPQALASLLAAIDAAGLPAWWEGLGPCPPGRRDRPALSLLQPGVGPDRPAGGLAGRAGRVRAHRLPRDGHGPKRTRLRRPGRAGGQAHPSGGRQSDLCFGGQRRAAVRHRRLWPRHGQTGWRQGRAAVPLPDPAALQRNRTAESPGRAGGPAEPSPCGRAAVPWPGRRGDPIHRLRPVRHLRHAAVGAAGPWPRPAGACRHGGPFPCVDRGGPGRPCWNCGQSGWPHSTRDLVWQGMLDRRLGDALWAAAGLSGRKPRPAGAGGLAQTGPYLQGVALQRPQPLRLEAGPDHRRRPLAGRSGADLPVQGLSGAVFCGRNAGLRRQLRRL